MVFPYKRFHEQSLEPLLHFRHMQETHPFQPLSDVQFLNLPVYTWSIQHTYWLLLINKGLCRQTHLLFSKQFIKPDMCPCCLVTSCRCVPSLMTVFLLIVVSHIYHTVKCLKVLVWVNMNIPYSTERKIKYSIMYGNMCVTF